MAVYIEYTLTDGGTLWIEADESTSGAIKAADASGNIIIKAEKMLQDSLASVKQSAMDLRQGLAGLQADEVEVAFGIKVVGETGLFAVAKTGAEVNYGVTLRWTKKE